MIFSVNGVIMRSYTSVERINELKIFLLGKKMTIDNEQKLTITDISLSNHDVVFWDKDAHFHISKVKKIEVDTQQKRIRIANKGNVYVIPFD